jgi:hypothetical protein
MNQSDFDNYINIQILNNESNISDSLTKISSRLNKILENPNETDIAFSQGELVNITLFTESMTDHNE